MNSRGLSILTECVQRNVVYHIVTAGYVIATTRLPVRWAGRSVAVIEFTGRMRTSGYASVTYRRNTALPQRRRTTDGAPLRCGADTNVIVLLFFILLPLGRTAWTGRIPRRERFIARIYPNNNIFFFLNIIARWIQLTHKRKISTVDVGVVTTVFHISTAVFKKINRMW